MTIDGVDIYFAEIHGKGREAECAAVASLVGEVFGDSAVLGHYSDGAPYVEGFDGGISVSHCRGLAVLAVDRSGRNIGVDVERWRVALQHVSARLLTHEEAVWASSGEMLLAAWTVKEAVYKALRPSGGMSMLAVRLPYEPTSHGVASGVRFTTRTLSDGAVITVAVKDTDIERVCQNCF